MIVDDDFYGRLRSTNGGETWESWWNAGFDLEEMCSFDDEWLLETPRIRGYAELPDGTICARSCSDVSCLSPDAEEVTNASFSRVDGLIGTTGGALVVAGEYGGEPEPGRLYRSVDGGVGWDGVAEVSSPVTAFAVGEVGIVAAGAEDGTVLVSLDDGETWVTAADTGAAVRAMAVDRNRTIYAATAASVVCSTDLGASWRTVDEGLHGMGVLELAADDRYLYAATDADGVYRLPLGPRQPLRSGSTRRTR